MSAPRYSRVRLSVPASSANLGSGFDALGLALELRDTVTVELADFGTDIEVAGHGHGEVPLDDRHLLMRGLRPAAAELGLPIPGLRVHCHNRIPHARGLGSSAAALAVGAMAACALAGEWNGPEDGAALSLGLRLTAEVEGHADNAAASLYGGAVVSYPIPADSAGDTFGAASLAPVAGIEAVAMVPRQRSSTHATRGLLPQQVPHADAAHAVGRAALLVHALTGQPDLLLSATEDRLHQDYRQPAWPQAHALMGLLRSHGVPAMISGAGPTVLALGTQQQLARIPPDADERDGFARHPVPVARHGVLLEERT